jgi:hypothetical protein
MTTTDVKVERKNGGMPKWAVLSFSIVAGKPRFYWPYTSDVGGKRFLTRFIPLFTPWGGTHITRVSMADDQRKYPHDHSATFASLKFGSYEEDVYSDPDDLSQAEHRVHRRFSCHVLRYNQAHSITRVSPHLVTILFLGWRRNKSSYWTPEGKIPLGMTMDDEW